MLLKIQIFRGFDKNQSYGLFSMYHWLAMKKLTATYGLSSKRLWFHTVKSYSQENVIHFPVLRNFVGCATVT
jgi:hypothetical protein